MADVLVKSKEAIVIVLDVGRSMHDQPKNVFPILEKAKMCVNMILQRKIFSESKDEIALVLFGTPETANKLADTANSEYCHIKVAQELKPASWDLLRYVQEIEGSEISADFIDALVVAMDILHSESNGKKFSSLKIMFFSNFHDDFCPDQVNTIVDGLKIIKMELIVIGPFALIDEDGQDANCLGYESKTTEQIKAESMVRKILKEVKGESYSFNEALPALIYYQKKKVQSLPWNANLDIGKNLTIPISAYIKVYESKVKPWKNAYAHKLNAKIEKETTFHLNDHSQTEVSKDNIIPAYRYGTTLVPYSEEDKVNMEYQSGEKGMKVLGFTKEENVHRYYYIGDKTMYIFGQKNRELAGVILAPFIQALFETKMVAIVRYVYSARSAPKIGFLSPRIKQSYECLIFIALPFMEDLRHFVFAPLDSDPKNLPTDEQLSSMDELINSMDLSVAASDDDGNRGEALKPKNTVNPFLQRLYQCLQHKIFSSDNAFPAIPHRIKVVIDPSPELLNASESVINKMRNIFPLKEVATKRPLETGESLFPNGKSTTEVRKDKKKRLFEEYTVEDSSEELTGAVDDIVIEVGTVNPVEDFQWLMRQSTDPISIKDVFKKMERAILRFLSDAMANMLYDKIISCLKEYRTTSIKKEEPHMYNTFIKGMKNTLISRNPILWTKIIEGKLGIISSSECLLSIVSFQEASEFYGNLSQANTVIIEIEIDDDDSDLLVQL